MNTSDIIKENTELKQQVLHQSKLNEMLMLYQRALLNEIEAMNQRFTVFNQINTVQNLTDLEQNPVGLEQNRHGLEQNQPDLEQNQPDLEQNRPGLEQNRHDLEQNQTNLEQNRIIKEINQNIKLIGTNNEVIKLKIEALLSSIGQKINDNSLLVLKNVTKPKSYYEVFSIKFKNLLNNKYKYNQTYPETLLGRLTTMVMLLFNTEGLNYLELRSKMNIGNNSISRYYQILNKLGFVKYQRGKKCCIYYLTDLGRNELSVIKYEIENS